MVKDIGDDRILRREADCSIATRVVKDKGITECHAAAGLDGNNAASGRLPG